MTKTFYVVEYSIPSSVAEPIKAYFPNEEEASGYALDVSARLTISILSFSRWDEELPDDTMFVWVVSADDHDYDAMSQWHVGVFHQHSRAIEAMETDRAEYAKQNNCSIKKAREKTNYEVFQTRVI